MQKKMDQETLIEHVQLCEPLYATCHPKYGDNIFKENAWRKIAKEMNQSATICKKVWCNLRDSYRRVLKRKRETKSGQSTTKIRKWRFEDEMSFLQPYMHERDTYTNLKDVPDKNNKGELNENENAEKNDEVGDGNDEDSDKDGDDGDADQNVSLNEVAKRKKEKEINRKIMNKMIGNRNSRQTRPERASSPMMMKCLLNKRSAHTQATPAPEPNSIDSFCSSIATTMKNFTPYYQNIAKLQIFNLISELEMNQIMEQDQFCIPNRSTQYEQSTPISQTVSLHSQQSCYIRPYNTPHPSPSPFRSPQTTIMSTPSPSPSVIPTPTPSPSDQ